MAGILELPHKLIVLIWKLLVELNRTHSFPDIANYKKMAAEAHRCINKTRPLTRPLTSQPSSVPARGLYFTKYI